MAVGEKFNHRASQNNIQTTVVGLTIVDVEHDSGLATSVDTRDRDKRTRCAAATVNNVDLGAADVELGYEKKKKSS